MKRGLTPPGAKRSAARLTADEFWVMSRNRRCELVEGEIVEMTPVGVEHGRIVVNLILRLGPFIEAQHLGALAAAEVGCRIRKDPDTVRAPDICFIKSSRIPREGLPRKFLEFAPDLAVEVISPGDSYEEVESKVHDWLEAGTLEVWVVNPRLREIKVHRPEGSTRVFGEAATLESEGLFPGFMMKVSEVFQT